VLFKPSFPVRAKVRIGEKRQSQKGNSFPVSVDYFVSDDEAFKRLCGDKPQMIRVRFVYPDVADNFSTGMEWWVKGKGNTLACYTKDGEKALRLDKMVNPDDTVVGEPLKSGRVPITCRFRDCPIFKRRDCKPMGRLVFQIDGDARDTTLQLDTKSWNSIEALTAAFSALGDPRGRVFELSVSFHQKGRDRFPVLALKEADVIVNSTADAEKADALIQLDKAVSAGDEPASRIALAAALDHTNPGWRDNLDFGKRIQAVGVLAAAKGLLERNLA
jgi:hypothetical protein